MAQQHLHDLGRVEIGIGAGLDLKAGQHRHREGVPQAVQCTQKSRSRESFRELRRQEFSRHSPAMLVQQEIGRRAIAPVGTADRSEEHKSELQSLMRISYAVFCLKKKKSKNDMKSKKT